MLRPDPGCILLVKESCYSVPLVLAVIIQSMDLYITLCTVCKKYGFRPWMIPEFMTTTVRPFFSSLTTVSESSLFWYNGKEDAEELG